MKNTLVVGLATFLSRVLGFLRNAVVSALFGQSWKADVLNAVFLLPFNLRKLMAEGALSTAFIPVLSRTLAEDPTKSRAQRLARSILTFQILILVPFTLLAIVFAQPIIAVLAPFPDPERQKMAVELFRWFINYLFLVSISAVLMAVLNAHHRFAIPAISPILFSLAVILSLVVLYPVMDIYAQIPGVLLGGIAQIVFQWVSYRKLGYSMKPLKAFWTPELKETVRKWGPAMTISLISLANQQISMTLAATLPEGSVSSLSNAIVFWQLPAGVLSASVITVFFPRMSHQVARQDWNGAAKTMVEGMELQALLLIPAGFFLALLSEPIIALAFQRGQFTYTETQMAARVLSVLSWGLFFSGAFNFLQRFFYAKGDFKIPFRISLAWAATDLTTSLLLMHTSLGVVGLAVGSVVGFFVGATCLIILAWKNLPLKSLGNLVFFLIRIGLALLPVACVFQQITIWTGPWWKTGLSWKAIGLLLGEGLGLLALLVGVLLAFGIRPWKLLRRSSS